MLSSVNSYYEFIQFIDEGPIDGYKVYLESETLGHDNWSAERFIQYVGEIEENKLFTGANVIYRSEVDASSRVNRVRVEIHFLADHDSQERSYTISWVVR